MLLVFHLYFTFSIHFSYVHIYCISSDYIIILYCFTFALMNPFMHLCTLYFICTVPENIVVWRFIYEQIVVIIIISNLDYDIAKVLSIIIFTPFNPFGFEPIWIHRIWSITSFKTYYTMIESEIHLWYNVFGMIPSCKTFNISHFYTSVLISVRKRHGPVIWAA